MPAHSPHLPRLLLAVVAAAALLPAQDVEPELADQFQRLDIDKDGQLSRLEFPGSTSQFAGIDQDKDGKCSLAEYLTSDAAARFLRANYRNRQEPRPRRGLAALAPLRFAQLARFEPEHAGRLTRAKWRGSDEAFLQLDYDDNGVLDARDHAVALAEAPAAPPPLPEVRGPLPNEKELLQRLDKNKDGSLNQREVSSQKYLQDAFARADRDGDGWLDEQELRMLFTELQRWREANQKARGKPVPYEVPFDTWDKDNDGKVQQNEWQGPRSLFDRLDLDRDAAVSRDEVARYRKRVTGDDFVQRFDLDGDGKVTPTEFGGPADAFRRADRNGDGVISKSDR